MEAGFFLKWPFLKVAWDRRGVRKKLPLNKMKSISKCGSMMFFPRTRGFEMANGGHKSKPSHE